MNNSDILNKDKGEIRKSIKRRLRELDPAVRAEKSAIIQEKLVSSEVFRKSRVVMFYVPLPEEVDTREAIKWALEQGKKVAVPYITSKEGVMIPSEIFSLEDLESGPFGIYQPKTTMISKVPLEEIDLVVVPAIAFDRQNRRLGRGKGYYDRFLSDKACSGAVTVGLAFDLQVLQNLPSDEHDIPVSSVITG
jgi:5-formyltetrahydrofolate cyclo-ligase